MSSVSAFVDLFSLTTGPLAPTEAPPNQRLPVLVEALGSSSPRTQRLALLACEKALQTGDRFRIVHPEPLALRAPISLWTPSSEDEYIDAYRQVWMLVRANLDRLTGDVQQAAVRALLRRARDVNRIAQLSDLVLETLHELSTRPYVDRREVVRHVEEIVRYEGRTFSMDRLDRWRAFRDELIGASFSSLLHRYVGLALLDDEFNEEGEREDKAGPFLRQLASQGAEHPELLDSELEWLLAGDAPVAGRFGYELAKCDPELMLLPHLLGGLRALAPRGNGYLLSGYLRLLVENDLESWEEQLDRLAEDPQLRGLTPELTWRGQLTDRAARRILTLARSGAITSSHFAMFGIGGVISSLSEEPLQAWLDFLLESPHPGAVAVALQIFFYYYVYDCADISLPVDLAWRILTNESFFRDDSAAPLDSMTRHTWQDTAVRYVERHPERGLPLAGWLLGRMQNKGGIDDGYSSPVFAVLNRVLSIDAVGVWGLVAPLLGPPVDVRAFRLGEWLHGDDRPDLRGREGALTKMPEAAVWTWVEADVEKRAWFAASLAPRGFFREPGKTCWAREVLVRYGDRPDVRRNIGANFGVEIWWGSEAEHWERKKADLLEYRTLEDNPRVLSWIGEYIEYLNVQVDRAKTEEERDW